MVRYDGSVWTRYGARDGLMDVPVTLIATEGGELWAAGSHDSTAATARFLDNTWSRRTHPELSWGIDAHAVYAASDGAVWFGASVDLLDERGHLGGQLRYGAPPDGSTGRRTWTHHTPPEVPASAYGIGQPTDGAIWFCGWYGLRRLDGTSWPDTEEETTRGARCDAMSVTAGGNLWVGTRKSGAFSYDADGWTHYGVQDGMADNKITAIFQRNDGTVLAATGKGISGFDGQTWIDSILPHTHLNPKIFPNTFRRSGGTAFWLNYGNDTSWNRRSRPGTLRAELPVHTIRHEPDTRAPDTQITVAIDRVSQPGNTILSWTGQDPWRETLSDALRYAYRMDQGSWTAFSGETSQVFFALPSGDHTFSVKARDTNFNEDPTPATLKFTVIPPVWQQAWFIGLVTVLTGTALFQTRRGVVRGRRLRESNRDIMQANQTLRQDRALERVRAEVSTMNSAEDLQRIVSEMLRELTEVDLDFNRCMINIIDETAGVRIQYGMTRQGQWSSAQTPLSDVSTAFMALLKEGRPVVRAVKGEFLEQYAASWKRIGIPNEGDPPAAILDAPFPLGTLSLTTSNPEGFTQEEISLVEKNAQVISLGYARFLDFERLDIQNRELTVAKEEADEANRMKSQFLANMSHELRTPLNAVIGYSEMLAEDAREVGNQESVPDLERIQQAGKHLLALVNDVLDIAKVEADKMEIFIETFSLSGILPELVATVQPLARANRNKLLLECAENVTEMRSDTTKIRQIVLNLLSNAAKFTENGQIKLSVFYDPDRTGTLLFEVSDTGIGTSEGYIEKLFEPFSQADTSTTRERGGSGLGLTITRHSCSMLNGDISVQSQPGKGSTFTLSLPDGLPDRRDA